MNFIFSLSSIPELSSAEFAGKIISEVHNGARVVTMFGVHSDGGNTGIYVLLADDEKGKVDVFSTIITGLKYPSLTPLCEQIHLFERELYEQYGIIPEGHPWLKPVRYSNNQIPASPESRGNSPIGICDFLTTDNEEIHEVAVGPVHAGIIEPGHFRFLCHGEDVLHLEISLGYQHRGIEKNIIKNPLRGLFYAETAAGDTSIGHAMAYCENMEALTGKTISMRAKMLRNSMLELERIANHTGDIGAMAGDIGFLPTSSYCGRIRGDFLNLTASICGNRFGRGMVRPGGVHHDLKDDEIETFLLKLDKGFQDARGAISLIRDNPSVLSRLENIGTLHKNDAVRLGIVGLPARACGISRDVRFNFKENDNDYSSIQISLYDTGDVYARAMVRWFEIEQSYNYIKHAMTYLPDETIYSEPEGLCPNSLTVSLVEGWRGEICHTSISDSNGKLMAYKIVDPSFHNWMGLSMAMRNQQISDFPLCNKSFNLSYCGHDL